MAVSMIQTENGNGQCWVDTGNIVITANGSLVTVTDMYHASKTGRILVFCSMVGYASAKTWQIAIRIDDVTVAVFPYNNTDPKNASVSYVAKVTPNDIHKITLALKAQDNTVTATSPMYTARNISIVDI